MRSSRRPLVVRALAMPASPVRPEPPEGSLTVSIQNPSSGNCRLASCVDGCSCYCGAALTGCPGPAVGNPTARTRLLTPGRRAVTGGPADHDAAGRTAAERAVHIGNRPPPQSHYRARYRGPLTVPPGPPLPKEWGKYTDVRTRC